MIPEPVDDIVQIADLHGKWQGIYDADEWGPLTLILENREKGLQNTRLPRVMGVNELWDVDDTPVSHRSLRVAPLLAFLAVSLGVLDLLHHVHNIVPELGLAERLAVLGRVRHEGCENSVPTQGADQKKK